MNPILVVARKEIKDVFGNVASLLMGLGFALFFAVGRAVALLQVPDLYVGVDSAIFFLAASIGLLMAYMNTSQVFLLEKRDHIIETLLCAPVNVRQVWLGKVIGATFLPYLLSILTMVIVVVIARFGSGRLIVPSVPILLYVFLVIPLFIAAFTGMTGFGQLLLGMRENRILNFVLFVPVFAALYGVGLSAAGYVIISWLQVGIIFGLSVAALGLTAFLARYLSKERIVTTIS